MSDFNLPNFFIPKVNKGVILVFVAYRSVGVELAVFAVTKWLLVQDIEPPIRLTKSPLYCTKSNGFVPW